MSPAHLSTSQRDPAGLFPRASRYVALSRHDHQKGHLLSALPRARGHGVVRVNHESNAAPSSGSVELHQLLTNCRGPGLGLFHSRSDARFLPMRCVRQRVCSFPLGQTRVHSVRSIACKRSRAHSVPAEQFLQSIAHRDHLSNVLFSGCTVREVSCATKGLGNVRKAFGELRNV